MKQMGMQRGWEVEVERNVRKKQTWKWLRAKLEGEQTRRRLEMTDSPFLCHNQKGEEKKREKVTTLWLSDHRVRLGLDKP